MSKLQHFTKNIVSLLPKGEQKDYFEWQLKKSKLIEISSYKDDPYIKKTVDNFLKNNKVNIKECYSNSYNLSSYDSKINYVEGQILISGIPIEHAWNEYNGIYFDLTNEIALDNSKILEYLMLIKISSSDVLKYALKLKYKGPFLRTYYISNVLHESILLEGKAFDKIKNIFKRKHKNINTDNNDNKVIEIPSKLINVVFLDLDSTLIFTASGNTFPLTKYDWKFNKKLIEVLIEFSKRHYKFIIVTNQGGIERGYVKESDFQDKLKMISKKIKEKYNLEILDSFYSTTNDREDEDRKPNPGMSDKANEKYNIDFSRSIMVGDKESDREFQENSQINRFYFVDDLIHYFKNDELTELN